MSTRCQILVSDKKYKFSKTSKFEEPLLYRHCDGYPQDEHGVIACIKPIIEKFIRERGFYDGEYLAARLMQHMCNAYDNGNFQTTGHGIDNCIHGDIAYFYVVTSKDIKVFEPVHSKNEYFDITGFKRVEIIKLNMELDKKEEPVSKLLTVEPISKSLIGNTKIPIGE